MSRRGCGVSSGISHDQCSGVGQNPVLAIVVILRAVRRGIGARACEHRFPCQREVFWRSVPLTKNGLSREPLLAKPRLKMYAPNSDAAKIQPRSLSNVSLT